MKCYDTTYTWLHLQQHSQLAVMLVPDALVNVGALPGVDGAERDKDNPVEAEDFAEQPALLHASSL